MVQSQTDEQMAQVEELLARIDQHWQALRDELDQIPDERKAEPNVVGTWSVKDVVGHIAVWDEVDARRVERALGKPDVEIEEMPWQERNDREAAARANRSLAENQAEAAQAHQHLVSTVRSLEQADAAVAAEWIAGLPEDTCDHYAEHLEQIRAWRTQ